VAIGLMTASNSAQATFLKTYDLIYSGAAFGNNAMARATMTLDLDQVNNPGFSISIFAPSFVTAFSITVSGARTGNGTFGLADFSGNGFFYLDTNGGKLDFNRQLIGQATSVSPYGTVPSHGNAGDFSIFTNYDIVSRMGDPAAPTGTDFFEITTTHGLGDRLYLTSFAPAMPEPGALVLTSLGLGSLAGCAGWRRIRRAIA
jgi:hypothetical protein